MIQAVRITRPHLLNPILEDCRNHIKRFYQSEHDRELSNREKEVNIKYGRKGYRISLCALILSVIAILIELGKALL